jgi:DNA repair exonuclease SbcCD ATPase subunit
MTIFENIIIEGFGSIISPITYKLNNPGLTIIAGPNGAGKTTITNALSWCVWGQLVKPKKSSFVPWPHVIDSTYKGTKVTVNYKKGNSQYQVIRCNDYSGKILGKSGKNRLIVIKDGKELIEEGLRNKADYQKWIINNIGYSFDLFRVSILFSQELDSLMKEDGPTKKKIFDEAFETMFIIKAREKVEERLKWNNIDYQKSENILNIKKAEETGLITAVQLTQDSIDNFQLLKDNKIKQIRKSITKLVTDKDKIVKDQDHYTPIYKKISELEKTIADLKTESDKEFKSMLQLNAKREEVDRIKQEARLARIHLKDIPKKCESCGRAIDPKKVSKYKKIAQSKLDKLNKALNVAEQGVLIAESDYVQKTKCLEKLALKKSKLGELQKKVVSAGILKERLKGVENEIVKKEKELSRAKKEKLPENKLLELKDNLKKTSTLIKEHSNYLTQLGKKIKTDQWLIKDPLSNSGLKAFIFDSGLIKLNNYLKQYTNIIGFGVKVIIDMASANKDIRILIQRGGDDIPFEDISKGQKQLVLVVLAFSMSDTVESIKPINVLFLDELFESLNKENIEKVGDIINKKAHSKSIHLITHQSSFCPTNARYINFKLNSKNQTVLEIK